MTRAEQQATHHAHKEVWGSRAGALVLSDLQKRVYRDPTMSGLQLVAYAQLMRLGKVDTGKAEG